MNVTVEYYGALGQKVGRRHVEMGIPEPCTVASLLHILRTNCPELDAILSATPSSGSGTPFAFAVNGRFVPVNRAGATLLHDGDKVTLMLLAAGG
jgi:sulfur carrier protein ThiS